MIQTGHNWSPQSQGEESTGSAIRWLAALHTGNCRAGDCTGWNPECDCHGPIPTSRSFHVDLSRHAWLYIRPLMGRVTRLTIIAPGQGIPELRNQIRQCAALIG